LEKAGRLQIIPGPEAKRLGVADPERWKTTWEDSLMTITVQVQQQGSFTIPVELQEKYDIRQGDTFQLVDFDGIFVLTPTVPLVPELAREIEQAREKAGLRTEDLLRSLREQRERYYQEKYASRRSA
jgi:bifunctional DNA-binding transcriptional regulator/antitoxin component of YhaV-PrlF toxin-antitoxin module